MRVRTLVAATDTAYTGRISQYISEHHADTIDISVCNTAQQLSAMLASKRFDAALFDEALIDGADLSAVDLSVLLRTDGEQSIETRQAVRRHINKHRRISLIVADILEQYASVAGNVSVSCKRSGGITAVWSPCGGTGATTVALAYSASKAAEEKEVFYLSLESFVSTHAYFGKSGKSISTVFEMLEGKEGNAGLLVKGIHNIENGIMYLCAPENFDDICILSPENVRELATCCSAMADELVVDLTCVCDLRTRQVFELADRILLVTNPTDTAKIKLSQFLSQSSIYESIRNKTTLVVNKTIGEAGTGMPMTAAVNNVGLPENIPESVVRLPYVNSEDGQFVYRTLSGCNFGL